MTRAIKRQNVKADKSLDEWVVAMFCDHGDPRTKRLIRASYSLESALNSWNKMHKAFSKNGFRCWQENRSGEIIRDSSNLKVE